MTMSSSEEKEQTYRSGAGGVSGDGVGDHRIQRQQGHGMSNLEAAAWRTAKYGSDASIDVMDKLQCNVPKF